MKLWRQAPTNSTKETKRNPITKLEINHVTHLVDILMKDLQKLQNLYENQQSQFQALVQYTTKANEVTKKNLASLTELCQLHSTEQKQFYAVIIDTVDPTAQITQFFEKQKVFESENDNLISTIAQQIDNFPSYGDFYNPSIELTDIIAQIENEKVNNFFKLLSTHNH